MFVLKTLDVELVNKNFLKSIYLRKHKGSSKYIMIEKYGKRKIRYFKNGNKYVIINGKKVKL